MTFLFFLKNLMCVLYLLDVQVSPILSPSHFHSMLLMMFAVTVRQDDLYWNQQTSRDD